ncbi:ketopantoate reductase family protein [Methylotuvimicrobium sp. KM1]|uniref:ketopantoate reductase family protein n=1 Tax=Methylotuvimicrobium sp. KM1 TaxID=3377707 RepID=UPI003850C8B7
MKPIKVLIVGAGAIGGFYGALLAKAGAEVSVVCRSEFNLIEQSGYSIESRDLGDWHFKPHHVLQHSEDYPEQADYVVLCTKAIDVSENLELIRPAVSYSTTIVFIQNGVETEQAFIDAFPDNEIISGLAFICCNRTGPGQIAHLAYGRLTLGSLTNTIGPKAEQLGAFFNAAGIECRITDDIIGARWQKCVWNAPFNPLSVLSGGLATQDILSTQEPLVRGIMREVVAIASACRHTLAEDIIERNIANTHTMPPYKTSMLLDYEQGRPMETEAILGNAVHAARRKDVPCPHLETLYALMKLRELQLAQDPNTD